MVNFNISPPELKNGEQHIATELWVYKDSALTDEELYIKLEDPDDLLKKTFSNELDPGETYYAVGRFIFDPGGLQGLCEPIPFIAENVIDIRLMFDVPSDNPPPVFIDPKDMYPPGEFTTPKIDTSLIKGNIESVTWVVLDTDSRPHFFSRSNTDKVSTIIDATLDPFRVYMLSASVTLENGNTTPMGTHVFLTGGFEIGDYKIDRVKGCKDNVESIYTSEPVDFDHNEVKIHSYGQTDVLKEFDTDTEIDVSDIDRTDFIVETTAVLSDDSTIGPIYHYIFKRDESSLPYCLPLKLGE